MEALYALGRAYVAVDKAEMALPLYRKALKIDGNDPWSEQEWPALASLGRMDEAAVYLKEAIERRLDMPAAYNSLVNTRKFTEEPPNSHPSCMNSPIRSLPRTPQKSCIMPRARC